MANENTRYGIPLLALNTRRPPDSDRGKEIVHLRLASPTIVETQVALWESGERDTLAPYEAAELLWSVPAALHLDGRLDAWSDAPGISVLLPGLQALAATPQTQWPGDQDTLRELMVSTHSSIVSTEELLKLLQEGETANHLNDLVLIFKYAAVGYQRPIDTVADLYRLARTLLAVDSDNLPSSQQEVIAWLTAPLVVPRVFTAPLGPSGPHAPSSREPREGRTPLPQPPRIDFTSPQGKAILRRLEQDLDDIAKLDTANDLTRKLSAEGIDSKVVARIVGSSEGGSNTRVSSRRDVLVRPLARQPESRSSRVVSVNIAGSPVSINVAAANRRASQRGRERDEYLISILPQNIRDRVRDLELTAKGTWEIEWNWPVIFGPAEPSPSYLKPVGRSDLLLVRQTTTGYRRAEIAYVENVLVGETRERKHSNRILSRDEIFESVERETEESSDLQATDRAELGREVSKVVSEDLEAEGSVKVTSRGPTKVVASANVSFGRSTEETSSSAEEFARETVERASKRMLERTKREVRSLFEQEIIEDNRHEFTRASDEDEHVSGVYQYLERVSRARIFSYGERELYDILVPEPAALIWDLAISTNVPGSEYEAPDQELFNSITLDNIAEKRAEIIRAFRVNELSPPPPVGRILNFAFSATGSGDNAKYATNKELQIKDGYVVTDAMLAVTGERDDGNRINGGVVIGTQVQFWEIEEENRGSDEVHFTFTPPLQGPTVGIGINGENFESLSGNIIVTLARTDERLRQWALEAYSEVASRYHQMEQEYQQDVLRAEAAQQIGEVTLPEGSRRRLEQIVRFELQRAAIGIMRSAPVNFDLMNDNDGTANGYPTVDLAALSTDEPIIRFLQQAFEWEHLSWVLHPYFWGRRDKWERTVVQTHPDPDFAAFLNAGSARLQLSVRPGFEGLVKHFMETGEAYEGNGLPRMGDSGYLPFIDEQLTSLGGPGEEVPWPVDGSREWDVVTPTPLVLVRQRAEKQLPTWDSETGDEVD